MRVVIIGGVAAGPKVASKIVRLNPEVEVILIEKDKFLSYAGCGLPYYISGVVKEQKELMCTPVGTVRDSIFFQKVKNVHVLTRTEAIGVDRNRKIVKIKDLNTNEEKEISYDKLVFATGATPVIPPIPGRDLSNVFTLHGVEDAEGIKAVLQQKQAKDVVIVGGGLIGVEVAEALTQKGARITLVEAVEHILSILDEEMAEIVEMHLAEKGVKVLCKTMVKEIKGNGKVEKVITDKGEIPADMVILAVGVRPQSKLAEEAGLKVGPKGGIIVDEYMRTSDPDIYAIGDCVLNRHLITGKLTFVPLGSTANKHGRVAAINICGGNEKFKGIIGSCVCKVFDYCVSRTGLTEREAREEGFDVEVCWYPAPDKAHFYPDAKLLILKLIVDKKTKKILGAQAVGPGTGDKRIDVVATAITAGLSVEDISNLDLCYAPPYAPAMDNIITAANIVRNKIEGYFEGITPKQVKAKLERKEDIILLDVRSKKEYDEIHIPGSILIPLGELRQRYNELPKDKEIITFCKISLRGYEAALILKSKGFTNVKVMDGGILMWPYEKVSH